MRYLYTFFLCFAALHVFSQTSNYVLSDPLDLPQTGWNKVLCLRNGNTFLVHFEPRKSLVVKIFDKDHKEIASLKHPCKILDINQLEQMEFKGLMDISGNAVLFVDQVVDNRHSLIRVIFDNTTAKIVDEKMIIQSPSMKERNDYYVLKQKNSDAYDVFLYKDVVDYKDLKLELYRYNAKHELLKQVPIDIDTKGMEYIYFVGAEAETKGDCIVTCLLKQVLNPTAGGVGLGSAAIYNRYAEVAYISNDSDKVKTSRIDLQTDICPDYCKITYDHFTDNFNMLLLHFKDVRLKNGLQYVPYAYIGSLFLRFDENSMSFSYKWVNNAKVNEYLQAHTDTAHSFRGIPIQMCTDENGLTTILYQRYERDGLFDNAKGQPLFNTYLGDMGITQVDDDGKEIWGTLLPTTQVVSSYRHFMSERELGQRDLEQAIFYDLPEFSYSDQFKSANLYAANKAVYIIYNDLPSNFNKDPSAHIDSVYDLKETEAVCYKVGRHSQCSKTYLFGQPSGDVSRATFTSSADFDEKNATYAALVLSREGRKYKTQLAWYKLE